MFDVPALRELLIWVSRFRSHGPVASFEAVHRQLLDLINALQEQCQAQEWSATHIEWASYALCAAVDEAVMSRADAMADRWAGQPLQLMRFGEYTAGRGFFDRMAQMRTDPAANGRVLRIYWLVLTHGFLGKLALQAKEQRVALIEQIQVELEQHGWLGRVSEAIPTQAVQPSALPWRTWCMPVLWVAGICTVVWMYRSTDHQIAAQYEQFSQQISQVIKVGATRD